MYHIVLPVIVRCTANGPNRCLKRRIICHLTTKNWLHHRHSVERRSIVDWNTNEILKRLDGVLFNSPLDFLLFNSISTAIETTSANLES